MALPFQHLLLCVFLPGAKSKDVNVQTFVMNWGWSGVAKVLCILCHQDGQLILAYSWARLLSL